MSFKYIETEEDRKRGSFLIKNYKNRHGDIRLLAIIYFVLLLFGILFIYTDPSGFNYHYLLMVFMLFGTISYVYSILSIKRNMGLQGNIEYKIDIDNSCIYIGNKKKYILNIIGIEEYIILSYFFGYLYIRKNELPLKFKEIFHK